jgi:hypothetical protein
MDEAFASLPYPTRGSSSVYNFEEPRYELRWGKSD